ncbi:hypothetical protein HBI56_181860 [Parastagonospora nodorum]|uniref:Uncharacterized protein n=1 Tax=Phaeosphaeria nodorum (strain SN15 / ATCC MYA-4574 / FGSC 10173) TaxID=321614 RepID=A0A7U2I6A8_PHANO|nr:hypothetical protein HBH56_187270 [Parastagonospora nodorum]QRD00978.1 hypothetical protein JI435_416090 [Parastagonospora nodorum SN15]KAH3925283.1 hypothetical protein HBH54_181290 [Parastagonospora nodorum]KAH3959183.1 hypothetical protein HBH52_245790 [Parastagonospora nodorum]KAH3984555.1 hypothetical protein HBH51_024830 [Parastagonospora nodorum]
MVVNTTVGILMTILFECSFLLHPIARPSSPSPDNNLRSRISPLAPPLQVSSDLRYIARLTQLAFDSTAHLGYVLTPTSAGAWCSVRDNLKTGSNRKTNCVKFASILSLAHSNRNREETSRGSLAGPCYSPRTDPIL